MCLEVCVDNVQAAISARQAGAERLELCAALDVGGVTPCRAAIESVRRRIDCPIAILIRPRTGDFYCDNLDYQQIVNSAQEASRCGAQAVVVGGLTSDGHLDVSLLRAVREAVAHDTQLVMHRAFDYVADHLAAIDQLVGLGYHRILTSGGPLGSCTQQLDPLARMVQYAAGRIAIMPGGGVTGANAALIVAKTGCTNLHGSFRIKPPPTSMSGDFGSQCTIDSAAIQQALVGLRHNAPLE